MQIKISSPQILKILNVLSWIIFIGVCIEAGGFLFNSFYALVLNPIGAKYFWNHLDLSSLYQFDHGYFFVTTTLINIVVVLKACLFYVIVKYLYSRKLDLSKPFSIDLRRFILNLGYLALGISVFTLWGANYIEWIMKKGIEMPALQNLHLAGAEIWLFMSISLFVIAQIIKSGIEIQSENELTV
ncbi:MAG: DUF2975 domain-containing protein [Sphingobacteriia bacterium]|nr:MAG: DUF2975 domain-containing protein [Sphingobacteriia bacterium]TAG32246.1 MAG: DUF2975 domain-containing protein [Sphingobacteriia bacterium]